MNVQRKFENGKLVSYTIDGVEQSLDTVVIKHWPLALQWLKLLAKPKDKGLGDIVERVIGPVGGDVYKTWYISTFGKPCSRCNKYQNTLNERFPL